MEQSKSSDNENLLESGFILVDEISKVGRYEFVCPSCENAQGYNYIITKPEDWKNSKVLTCCSRGCEKNYNKNDFRLLIYFKPHSSDDKCEKNEI